MVEKNSNDISSESTHQIHSHKIIHIPREGVYESCSKKIRNVKFCIFANLFFVFVNMGLYRGKSFKEHLL